MEEEFILTPSGERYFQRLGEKWSQEPRYSTQEAEDNTVLSVISNKGSVTAEDFMAFGGEKFQPFYKGILRRLFEAGLIDRLDK